MKSAFDRLNLRPSERRLVVGVGTVLFIVLNMVFVWPYFSERSKALDDVEAARSLLAKFQKEIAQKPDLEKKIRTIEASADPVPEEDQGTEFELAITRQASQSGVNITGSSRMTTRTNQFFLERSKTVTFISEEQQLVDFLYNLGSGASLTRVRDLSLRPDAPKQRLTGNVKIVASYQKKMPAKPAPAPTTTTGGSKAVKPGAKSPAKAETKSATPAKPAASPATKSAPAQPPGFPPRSDKPPRK